jgi:hypothetical protein
MCWFKEMFCFESKYAEYNGNVKKAYASGDADEFTVMLLKLNH